jgi:hypothetical protein
MRAFLKSKYGKFILAIILGFGLSTLFRKTCKDKKCIKFKGPSLEEIEKKTYEYDKKCYKFEPNVMKCNPVKRTVSFS